MVLVLFFQFEGGYLQLFVPFAPKAAEERFFQKTKDRHLQFLSEMLGTAAERPAVVVYRRKAFVLL